jgi:serine/threonine protein kinase
MEATENYGIDTTRCLGKGATSSVYYGYNKKSGQQVAIKIYAQQQHLVQRELNVLASIEHKNVIKFLDYEPDLHAIILPYCQFGSVQSLLLLPQNMFGFPEEEFIILLRDVSCGLKYLKQNNIIHRDIKPGNIMKAMDNDGATVYILADFGGARELKDGDVFTSLHGTEGYLHPQMYNKLVNRQDSNFTAIVDLWSLGVTIYHVATGKTPFRMYGKQTAATIYNILMARKPGDISGIQTEPDGLVQRFRHLPKMCHLSEELRKMLEPILAKIFNPKQSATFEEYFNAVDDIVNRLILSIFYVQCAKNIKLFLNKSDSYCHIQEKLADITDIPAGRQLILVENTNLNDMVENLAIQDYPKSIQKSQLFLFELNGATRNPCDIPIMPHVESDNKHSAIACYVKEQIIQTIEKQTNLIKAEQMLRIFAKHKILPFEEPLEKIYLKISLSEIRVLSSPHVDNNGIAHAIANCKRIQKFTKDLKKVHACVCCENQCVEKATNLCQEILTLVKNFEQNKDAQIQSVKRSTIEENCTKLLSLYHSHCLNNLQKIHNCNYVTSMLVRLDSIKSIKDIIQDLTKFQKMLVEQLTIIDQQHGFSKINWKERFADFINTEIPRLQGENKDLQHLLKFNKDVMHEIFTVINSP